MALAEARAAWQRTANRCLVQEDAKRAPKLACCSSVSPSIKQPETGLVNAAGGKHIPNIASLPLNRNPSYSNLSPNSKWWLANCRYQKVLMDEQFEGNMETCYIHESSEALVKNEDDVGLINQATSNKSSCNEKYVGVEGSIGFEVLKDADKLCLNPESSWIGSERNTPWWRTADTDELASLVAQRSLDHIENCDLPRPQSTCVKNNVDANICYFSHDGVSGSLLDPKLSPESHHHFSSHLHTPTARSACQKPMPAEDQLVSTTDKPLRDMTTYEGMPTSEKDASMAELMEALRHSQTRAREAERAAKQAYAQKDHVVKLVFKQASHLFAYKQWLRLLQLENTYLQLPNNKSQSVSVVCPKISPQSSGKIHKTSPSRKRSCPQYDVSKYAVLLALGLGLAGAGFLLGCTIGWMLPTW